MKKRMKGLLLGAVMAGVLVLAGCGSSAPEGAENITEDSVENYVQKAQEILEAADGFAADFSAKVQMKGSK